jgi:hypothetical protein
VLDEKRRRRIHRFRAAAVLRIPALAILSGHAGAS